MKKPSVWVAALLTAWIAQSTIYTINDKERAVVTWLGKEPVADVTDAGLHFKLPWPFNMVRRLEKRMFIYESEHATMSTKDKNQIVIDLFAFVQISDGILFYQKVGSEEIARSRVDTAVFNELRNVIGNHNLTEVIGDRRDTFMEEIRINIEPELAAIGLSVPLVRANRTDFPEQNKASIYDNMSSERRSVAAKYRAEGASEAERIRAAADQQFTTTVSNAERQALTIRGEGEAEAARISNEAYGKDPEFYDFYRGLQAARNTLTGEDVRYLLTGDEPHIRSLFATPTN